MASNEELTIDLGVDTQETINIKVDLDAKVVLESIEELQSALESVRKKAETIGKNLLRGYL